MYLETIQWGLNRSYGTFEFATKMAFRYTLIYPEFGFYVKDIGGGAIFKIEAVRRKKALKKKKKNS